MRSKILRFLKNIFLIDILYALKITIKNFFKKKYTIQYPEEKTPYSKRFRGLHALRRYPNNEERCISCKLCESVCPALAINIETEIKNGIRRAKIYEIDLFKCIYCGLCEEACPVDAIVETDISHYTFNKKGQNIMNKEQLLKIGDKYKKRIDKMKNYNKDYR